jgi:hypothetical protein
VRGHETRLKDNGFWLGGLADAYEFGDDPEKLTDLQSELARIDNDHVKAAAKRFLDTSQVSTGVLLPKKGK